MWTSHSFLLAFLIAALSGVWPYVKLVAMLWLWFVPVEHSYVMQTVGCCTQLITLSSRQAPWQNIVVARAARQVVSH